MEQQQTQRAAQQEAAFERQQAMIAKMQRFIDRFGTHVAKAAQAQSRAKKIDKIERLDPPVKREIVPFMFARPPRVGEDVAVLRGLEKAYGARAVYKGLDFEVRRGERWCVMGRNGAGKTTLLRLIAGALQPDTGSIRLGASLRLGYFAQQSLQLLDADRTVWEQMQHDFPQETIGALRGLLGAFQFSGDEVEKKVRSLSGGERSRLVLARMLLHPPNFMVLDEPTNHLDLATKEMLIGALENFEGTMIFVSHDRAFLRGLSNRVLELGGETGTSPTPVVYPGSYGEYVQRTGHEAPGVHA
jgi:ATPase subunit of ABC transporter with duplicated ATPase domains